MKKILLFFLSFLSFGFSFGQAPSIQWQKCFGGTNHDIGVDIDPTSDGGYVIIGSTSSNDGDVNGLHGQVGGSADIWVAKMDSMGNIQWQKCLGGSNVENGFSIRQTKDSGYIVAGLSGSNDGNVSGNHYPYGDLWVVKLDGSGKLQWQKCFGSSGGERAYSVNQTFDGGYILGGITTGPNCRCYLIR